MQNEFKLGYAFGLLVGEGSFTGTRHKPSVAVKLHVDDPEPLEILKQVFGGAINGPYSHQSRNYYIWQLRGGDLRKSLPLIKTHLPTSKKRRQYEQWLSKYKRHFEWPWSNPD